MQDRQSGGLLSFWRSLCAAASTPDPVIGPETPARADVEAPTADQYPYCRGRIPLDHSDVDLAGRSPSFDGPRMH